MDEITERSEDYPFRERFMDQICSFQSHLFYLLTIQIALLLLLLFSLVYIEPGTASYIILQADFLILGVSFVLIIPTLYVCAERQ